LLDKDHPPKSILHFKDLSLDGVVGKSRIIQAKEAIGLGLAAEKFGAEFFGNGSQARGVLEHPGMMGDEAYANFKKSWESRGHHSTPILEEGMAYKQITIPPEAAQFIASREFQLQDIARVYRVPPHLLADLSRATFSNIEHSDIQFVKYTLRPLVKRYEQELEVKLLGKDLGKKNIRFNLDGILRGDTAARSQYYATMKQNKIMTTNEIRAHENMNPIEGGDILENPSTTSDKSTYDE
jgi:HK97 family phage portal protein